MKAVAAGDHRVASHISFSSRRPPAQKIIRKKKLETAHESEKKNTTNAWINTNLMQILRPRCNFDRQFSEFIHNPYGFCSFHINNYYNQEHIV